MANTAMPFDLGHVEIKDHLYLALMTGEGPPKLMGAFPISAIDLAETFSGNTPSLVLAADASRSLGSRKFLLRVSIPR